MSARRFITVAGLSCVAALVAGAAAAVPAVASETAIVVAVASDGHGPFTPADGPASDSGPKNGVVRTFDAITYEVTVNSTGTATNETAILVAPDHTRWAGLPTACAGSGSEIDGRSLVCNFGTLTNQSRAVQVVLTVTGAAVNGESITLDASVHADASETVRAASPTTRVSAGPRFDLSKNVVNPLLATGVTGPDGTTRGVSLTYPISIAWNPPVAGQGLLGYERLGSDVRFSDDVSQMFGGLASPAQLLTTATGGGCGANSVSYFTGLPGGRGGGSANVLESGVIRCTQSAPGRPVDVTIRGMDTAVTPTSLPTTNLLGGPIVGGQKIYVGQLFITLWVPLPPTNDSFAVRNVYSRLSLTSASGQSNFAEPIDNNIADVNIANISPGGGFKFYARVLPSGATAPNSGKVGTPWVTPGTLLRSQVDFMNGGLGSLHRAIACDVFDNRNQVIAKNRDGAYATRSGGTSIEYAAGRWTTSAAARDATCDDQDGPWYSSADDVPGGPAAVGKVRLVGDVAGGSRMDLFTFLSIRPAPNGTRVRNYGQLGLGDGRWLHDTQPAGAANGGLADFVTITADLARITRKIVDPGTSAETTPDRTTSVTAGDHLTMALYPTLTNSTSAERKAPLTLVETLPTFTSYVPGSASVDPTTVETVRDADGNFHQVLTWSLPAQQVNAAIPPVTYQIEVSRLAPAGRLTFRATTASPGDVSDVAARTAARALGVLTTGGVAVEKRAIHPVVETGDDPGWYLGYVNTASGALDHVTLIDILPYSHAASASSFHGRVALAGPLDHEAADGDLVTYTATDPTRIDLDPGAPSNSPSGATRWCTTAQFRSLGCPLTLKEATAFRVERTAPLAVGHRVIHTVHITTTGQRPGDRYTNQFGLRAANLALPVVSNRATVTLVGGEIGSLVWNDANRNGLQDPDETGAARVAVALRGADDRGRAVTRSMRTDHAGRYRFTNLRAGDYTVDFTRPAGSAWTILRAGDPARDSDAEPDGFASITLKAVFHDGELGSITSATHVDAGLTAADSTLPPTAPAITRPTTTPSPSPISAGGPVRLAFTGAILPVSVISALALGAVAVGVIALGWARRRSGGRGRRKP